MIVKRHEKKQNQNKSRNKGQNINQNINQNKTQDIIREKLLRLLYPPSCPVCGELFRDSENRHDECVMKLPFVREPCCLRCGKEIAEEEEELCSDCSNRARSYLRGFPAMNYLEPLPESLAAFKYQGRRDYAEFYAGEIVRHRGAAILAAEPDVLIPVPIHKAREKKRGYNQAEELARALSCRLHIPMETELLVRRINTLPQKSLNDDEREKNLKRAFISSDKIVKYKRAMLVDDIYTTGATVEACTKILLNKGIEAVYYTAVCIGKGY